MRNATITSSNIIGNAASIRSARAIVAARNAHTQMGHGKRLTHVKVPVVSVCGSLCERPDTKRTTYEQPTAMWQMSSSEMPAAVWAAFVLNRTTSV